MSEAKKLRVEITGSGVIIHRLGNGIDAWMFQPNGTVRHLLGTTWFLSNLTLVPRDVLHIYAEMTSRPIKCGETHQGPFSFGCSPGVVRCDACGERVD